jgi:UDP-2,4-diacetamido-2,4,6-trideoxy-beta-L-altropyranose hydrolase
MNIVFRVDASQSIGSGHVMRCLVLAKAIQNKDTKVIFITRNHIGNLNQLISSKGYEVRSLSLPVEGQQYNLSGYEQWLGVEQKVDAEQSIALLDGTEPDLLIVDHYALDKDWESRLRPYVKTIFVVDDLANRKHDGDWILDQNYNLDNTRYDRWVTADTVKLLGPQYSLLRDEFTRWRAHIRDRKGRINRIFLFFGGFDPDNLTLLVLKALQHPQLSHIAVDVVTGIGNPYGNDIRNFVAEHPNTKLHVQVENIAELMVEADLAVGAGGSTTWERMALGLPSVVVTIAENQIPFTRALSEAGYLNWLGNGQDIDQPIVENLLLDLIDQPKKLSAQSLKCQELVDGQGVDRVVGIILGSLNVDKISARNATQYDCKLYWYWANDLLVRKNAFRQESIGWEDHKQWFTNKLADNGSVLLIVSLENIPIGQVRFDRDEKNYRISYTLAKQFRGKKLGTPMLAEAINFINSRVPLTLVASVKESNLASVKIFRKLGFSEQSSDDEGVIHYCWVGSSVVDSNVNSEARLGHDTGMKMDRVIQ